MSQPIIVIAAIVMTDGTNTAETLSAILAMGAFVAAASATILIICERVVSSPTLEASHLMKPERLTVPAEMKLPSCLSTGRLSPVSADSSTALVPSMTVPSTGMLSPGRTTKISPFCTLSTGTDCSLPSLIIFAVLGASSISPLSASVVLPFERDSSILPTVIRVRIIAADSK